MNESRKGSLTPARYMVHAINFQGDHSAEYGREKGTMRID